LILSDILYQYQVYSSSTGKFITIHMVVNVIITDF